jgi:hypothetical protein
MSVEVMPTKKMSAEVEVMPAAEARAVTDQIKTGVEAIWELIKQAYTLRAWVSLGYSSWSGHVGQWPRHYVGTKIADLATVFAVASVESADWFNPSIAHTVFTQLNGTF